MRLVLCPSKVAVSTRRLLTSFLFIGIILFPVTGQAPVNTSPGPGAADIRLNQLGYYTEASKRVAIVNSSAHKWILVDALGSRVFSGKFKPGIYWDKSGDTVKIADFSKYTRPGTYQLYLPDKGYSYAFEIKPAVYNEVLKAAVRTFYYQRASMPLEEKFAGIFARPAGHPDDVCYFHPSTGHSTGMKASPGGWYDAGDYNKYIVNAGITVSMMLSLAELFPGSIPDGFSNIPESGNGKNDLLDELQYELDWMLTMQDQDGGVFHKLTNLGFDAFQMPEKSTDKRYFVGKSTTATLCFAASLAQASRVFRPSAPDYAGRLLDASKKAFDWAQVNPTTPFRNPPDVVTGPYANDDAQDEFFWAAAELLRVTGDRKYHSEMQKYRKPLEFNPSENWRLYLRNLGYYTLLMEHNYLSAEEAAGIRKEVLQLADDQLIKLNGNPYQIPLEVFEWGSNSDILDLAMLFAYAWQVTGELRYRDAVIETTDYIFGKNATGYSFVTGYGSKTPMFPHHRPSGSDGIAAPVPGFVVGGPNVVRQDAANGAKYSSLLPAKSYTDMQDSYASNEICINWNGPLVFVLGYLEAKMRK